MIWNIFLSYSDVTLTFEETSQTTRPEFSFHLFLFSLNFVLFGKTETRKMAPRRDLSCSLESLISRHQKVKAYCPNTCIVKARAIFCAALTIACGLLPRLSIFAIVLELGNTPEKWKKGKNGFFHNKVLFLQTAHTGLFSLYLSYLQWVLLQTSLEPLFSF